ncbi:hypothetical protein JCM10213v2_003531 [Rhodosporidiobolus nylandii]
MEPEGAPGGRDRLSSLPVELLERIFELAYEGEDTTTGAISRALLPFDRKERFKRVEVTSTDDFRRLVAMVKANASLGKAIRTLECCDVEDSLAAPSEVDVKVFFHSLSRLSGLFLHSACPPIQRLAFSSFYARVRPPSLASLAIVAPPSWTRPWEPSLFRHLASSLTSLALTVHVDNLASPDTTSPTVTLPFLTSLVLAGAHLDCPAVRRLLEAGPNLSSVTLRTSNEEHSFLPLLALLPDALRALRLETPGTFDSDPPVHACDTFLRRFQHLEHLYLGQSTFDPVSLPSSLAELPHLSTLGFGRAADLVPEELHEMLAGPGRLVPLRTLVLDLLTPGKRGYSVDFWGSSPRLHPHHSEHPFHLASDWVVPEYTDPFPGFEMDDAIHLADSGAANGVKVQGTAIDGINVFLEAEEEQEHCLALWAWQSGDWQELYEQLGWAKAETLLSDLGAVFSDSEDEEDEVGWDYPSLFAEP